MTLMISQQEARNRARDNWNQWRLVLSGLIRYSELDLLDPDDIMEANAALDLHLEEQNKKNKPPK